MKHMLLAIGLATLAATQPVHATTGDASLTLKDAKTFFTELIDMGYAPQFDPATPNSALITSNGDKVLLILGGCEASLSCKYAVLLGYFKDDFKLSGEQLNKLNADYDLIKVWLNVDGKVTYTMGVLADGMPRANFRATVDLFQQSSMALAGDLLKLNGTSPSAQPAKH